MRQNCVRIRSNIAARWDDKALHGVYIYHLIAVNYAPFSQRFRFLKSWTRFFCQFDFTTIFQEIHWRSKIKRYRATFLWLARHLFGEVWVFIWYQNHLEDSLSIQHRLGPSRTKERVELMLIQIEYFRLLQDEYMHLLRQRSPNTMLKVRLSFYDCIDVLKKSFPVYFKAMSEPVSSEQVWCNRRGK